MKYLLSFSLSPGFSSLDFISGLSFTSFFVSFLFIGFISFLVSFGFVSADTLPFVSVSFFSLVSLTTFLLISLVGLGFISFAGLFLTSFTTLLSFALIFAFVSDAVLAGVSFAAGDASSLALVLSAVFSLFSVVVVAFATFVSIIAKMS